MKDSTLDAPDGTRIAYTVEGSGPAMVLSNGLTTSTFFWKYTRPVWLQKHTVVTWDLPGHGRSGPAQSEASATLIAQPSFIAAIMREAGIERAAQVGWSTGAQTALETYRQFPELCTSLCLLFGGAGCALDNTRLPVSGSVIDWLACKLPRPVFASTFRALSSTFRQPFALPLSRRLGLVGPHVTLEDMREMTDHIAQVEPHTLQRLAHSCQVHDARVALASLRVPLLIMAGDKDPFAFTEHVGLPLHRAVPGSELVRLPEGTHTALLEEPALIAERVEDFLARHA